MDDVADIEYDDANFPAGKPAPPPLVNIDGVICVPVLVSETGERSPVLDEAALEALRR